MRNYDALIFGACFGFLTVAAIHLFHHDMNGAPAQRPEFCVAHSTHPDCK